MAENMNIEPGTVEPMEIASQNEGEVPYKLALSTRSQRETVSISEVNEFYGLVSVEAPEYDDKNRSGIDCVCVLDVSGSMRGEKISLVRKAMRRLVRAFSAKDRVCFVTFDSNVKTLMEFTTMDKSGKEKARKLVHALKEGSSTNLSGGLATGIAKMKELFLKGEANEITSVLLFTDGEANVGERTIEGILREAMQAAAGDAQPANVEKWSAEEVSAWLSRVGLGMYKGVFQENQVDGEMLLKDINDAMLSNDLGVKSIHLAKFSRETGKLRASTSQNEGEVAPIFSVAINTFGFGASHNNDLLNQIAQKFDGMYYYMEDEKSIVAGFANCLGGMLSTVAQQITVTFKVTNGVTKFKVHKDENVTVNADGTIKVVVGDLQAEENQDVLISCTLPEIPTPTPSYEFFTCDVTYRNVVTEKDSKDSLAGAVARVEGKTVGEINIKVDVEKNRVLATEAMETAKKFGDAKNLEQGRVVINKALTSLKESSSASQPFVESLMGDLTSCLDGLRDTQQYRTVGKGYMMQNVRCHKKKRAANYKSSAYRSQAYYNTSSRAKNYDKWNESDEDDSDDDDFRTHTTTTNKSNKLTMPLPRIPKTKTKKKKQKKKTN